MTDRSVSEIADWIYPRPQRLEVVGGTVPASVLVSVQAEAAPPASGHAQGYRLEVDEQGVSLQAHDEAGLFYGRQTLAQLRDRVGGELPCLIVEDWPDLAVRGYMLDVSRDRVPTMPTIMSLIDQLARLRINQLQVYTEHTLAYAGHESVWRDASALTFEEYAQIEAYCRARHIDLVPCQNVFGHMERWLTKPAYRHLAETLDGWDTPWGYRRTEPNSLDPSDPRSFELSADLIGQLARHARSDLLNIGCDETNDLGQGKSRARVERDGRAAVYLDYLQRLCAEVQKHDKTPMFWGDIVLHHPELIPQVPADAVLLNWGYEAGHDWMAQGQKFADAGVRFYVCPGTSSWCSITGRGQNAVENCREAAEAGIAHGAEGMLITDWGDHGHWQPRLLSWPGLIHGAGVAWCLARNQDAERLPPLISRIGLNQPTEELGRIVWELSNVYTQSAARLPNATWWFHVYRWPEQRWDQPPRRQVSAEDLHAIARSLAALQIDIDAYQPTDGASSRYREELAWCVSVALWAVRQSPEAADLPLAMPGVLDGTPAELRSLAETHRQLWQATSRPGGLDDSVDKLTRILRET
jgi:hypothetical protein